ncbi:hypothetical protein SDC9_139708 [bioreactor metagenome]|uniref:Uncharacterized protein n=1 Tax=bioreactor metagenome TaxID=1076179 RepID=A0A645DVE8_9ZZZZ
MDDLSDLVVEQHYLDSQLGQKALVDAHRPSTSVQLSQNAQRAFLPFCCEGSDKCIMIGRHLAFGGGEQREGLVAILTLLALLFHC